MIHHSRQRQHRRGLFLADAMIGFAITAVLGLVLVTAITQTKRSQERLDETTTATRIARRVMTDLQAGKPAPAKLDDAQITVSPATGGVAVTGQTWVEVTVNYHGHTATLIGLAPKGGAK
jgi:Na+-transporting NADH:ubiquinone oxidoreductase subunit NqrF